MPFSRIFNSLSLSLREKVQPRAHFAGSDFRTQPHPHEPLGGGTGIFIQHLHGENRVHLETAIEVQAQAADRGILNLRLPDTGVPLLDRPAGSLPTPEGKRTSGHSPLLHARPGTWRLVGSVGCSFASGQASQACFKGAINSAQVCGRRSAPDASSGLQIAALMLSGSAGKKFGGEERNHSSSFFAQECSKAPRPRKGRSPVSAKYSVAPRPRRCRSARPRTWRLQTVREP